MTNADDLPPETLPPALVAAGIVPPDASWTALEGGRTNRLWRVSRPSGGLVVVKLYRQAAPNPLFPNDPAVELRLLRHLSGHGIAPHPLYFGKTPAGPCLVYAHLAGAAWTRGAYMAASVLKRLHAIAPPPGLRNAPDGSLALGEQTAAILARCESHAAHAARSLMPRHEVPALGRATLLHGDPVAANMVVGETGARLIDWQCPAIGDPCEDIALFLSPAMQMAYRGAPLTPADVTTFLKAYDAPDILSRYTRLAPWYHARSYAYAVWQATHGEATAIHRANAEKAALEISLDRLGEV